MEDWEMLSQGDEKSGTINMLSIKSFSSGIKSSLNILYLYSENLIKFLVKISIPYIN
jgi:hypothetical protein